MHSSKAVVIVDDDELFRESLGRNLADAGFRVTDFACGGDALDHLGEDGPEDLVLLDWRMPTMNGIEVLKRLREKGSAVPVIFLTALTEQIYEEAALATGAVDFIDKSRSFAILLKRINLILAGQKGRQAGEDAPGDTGTLRVGPLRLRVACGRATWRGQPVDLTLAEFRMVHHLARHAGEDVGYRALYDLVRGSGFFAGDGVEGYRANVRTFIKRIRQKFRSVDGGFDEIGNYAGFGYSWRRGDSGQVQADDDDPGDQEEHGDSDCSADPVADGTRAESNGTGGDHV